MLFNAFCALSHACVILTDMNQQSKQSVTVKNLGTHISERSFFSVIRYVPESHEASVPMAAIVGSGHHWTVRRFTNFARAHSIDSHGSLPAVVDFINWLERECRLGRINEDSLKRLIARERHLVHMSPLHHGHAISHVTSPDLV